MPTKRAILAALTRHELRAAVDAYDVQVDDRRIKTQLVDALAGPRGYMYRPLWPGVWHPNKRGLKPA